MNRLNRLIAPLLVCSMLCACGRKDSSASGESPALPDEVVADTPPAYAGHLGFATRVPADCDFHLSLFYDGSGLFDSFEKLLLASGMGYRTGIEVHADESDETPDEEPDDSRQDVFDFIGTEAFVFIGGGLGEQLQVAGTTYRELSAAWAGLALDTLLGAMADGDVEPDFEAFGGGLMDKLADEWMAAIEKDSRLRVPSIVAGWLPDAGKTAECLTAVEEGLAGMFREQASAKPVEFERHGARMKGYAIEGVDVFAEWIDALDETLRDQVALTGIDAKERVEKLAAALRNVKFTVTSGVCDGRVIIYFGDGADGFRLADDPHDSLAGREALRWMEEAPGQSIHCAAYLSKAMVDAALPWLDSSAYWESLAGAVGPPLRDETTFRKLLLGMAGVTRQMGRRETSEWSAAVFSGPAWVMETRGGMVDPSLDYETPLSMRDAALAVDPAFVAHWVQNREWNDLSWSKLEHIGALLELMLREWNRSSPEGGMWMLPDDITERFVSEVIALNRMYRDELRQGIGDEVAVFGDFLGEMPALPGIPQKMVNEQTVPRLAIARPVANRERITAAGASLTKSLRGVAAWLSESSGIELPAVLPQSVESAGMVTWYPPLPFIGGDFVPGVSIDERLWMLGTSRSLARDFSKAMADVGSAGETGVIIEMDLEKFVIWAAGLSQYLDEEDNAPADEDMEAAAVARDAWAGMDEVTRRWKKFSYRSWLEEGVPRASYRLEFKNAP